MTHSDCGGLIRATDEPPYEYEVDDEMGRPTYLAETPVFRCTQCGGGDRGRLSDYGRIGGTMSIHPHYHCCPYCNRERPCFSNRCNRPYMRDCGCEPPHPHDCICADCAGAELTADND